MDDINTRSLPKQKRRISRSLHRHLLNSYTLANDCLPIIKSAALNSAYQRVKILYQEAASATTVELVSASGMQFTLKRVAKQRLFCSKQAESALRELELCSELAHPNIVHLLSAGETSEEYLYLMEYLPHANHFVERLEINNKPLMLRPDGGLQKLQGYCRDILSALKYLHSHGVIHMDIKPGNLLVTEKINGRRTVKLCDFGLSRRVDSKGKVYLPLRCGTEAYMAPEIKSGGWVTAAADMWSFGMFLYMLTVGYTPSALDWNKIDPLPQYKRHWKKYEGTGLYELLSACLRVDPETRLSSDTALAHPFLNKKFAFP